MEKIGTPGQKHLVYTCAGDRSNIPHWLQGERNFDLWVTYYGDQAGRYNEIAEFYNSRKGKKFPNLHYVYEKWPHVLGQYEAVFVVDDDIIMTGSEISHLFEIRAQYDLWLLQPAFHPQGKISHPITHMRPWHFMRYTNFVEVTCPLFRKDKLDEFMVVYNPEKLVGWGIDWWFLEILGPHLQRKVAVVDAVSCVNPLDKEKGEELETDEPQYSKFSRENQEKLWDDFYAESLIQSPRRGYKVYSSVSKERKGRIGQNIQMFLSLASLSFQQFKWQFMRRIS
ncbi:MAG: hypothetical protein JRK53_07100 [Deltaproteobacteria bacterium]|nr:hypothetical protein [Deltaproteobacteria bacterium]